VTAINANLNGTPSTMTVAYDSTGNITARSDVGTYTYGTVDGCGAAGPHAVKAVAGTKNASYCYDLNGDMTAGDGRTITWSSFGMPVAITKGLRQVDLTYGPDRARFKRVDTNETGQTTTYYVAGGAYEVVVAASGQQTRKATIAGVAVVIDVVSGATLVSSETRYLLKDHLGSVDVVTDASGAVLERLSFDAHYFTPSDSPPSSRPPGAKRGQTPQCMPRTSSRGDENRSGVEWTAYAGSGSANYLWQSQIITRGYTGHEQLDSVDLVHMNGRVYDPEIGRFLSADPFIADITNSQALNAYAVDCPGEGRGQQQPALLHRPERVLPQGPAAQGRQFLPPRHRPGVRPCGPRHRQVQHRPGGAMRRRSKSLSAQFAPIARSCISLGVISRRALPLAASAGPADGMAGCAIGFAVGGGLGGNRSRRGLALACKAKSPSNSSKSGAATCEACRLWAHGWLAFPVPTSTT
jgi:RHS repeat-associated protein